MLSANGLKSSTRLKLSMALTITHAIVLNHLDGACIFVLLMVIVEIGHYDATRSLGFATLIKICSPSMRLLQQHLSEAGFRGRQECHDPDGLREWRQWTVVGADDISGVMFSRLSMRALLIIGFALLARCYDKLSKETLEALPDSGDDFDISNGALLSPILRPRHPGTPAILEVLQHFVDFFEKSLPDWHLEIQNATMDTPEEVGKPVTFRNLIATRDPPWAKPGDVGRLTLTAHYDSLIRVSSYRGPLDDAPPFIGAIDSAAPCAMIMHIARSIDAALTKKWEAMQAERDPLEDKDEEKGIQIILFDGEEAFVKWTRQDSTYGSRALATHWEGSQYPAMSTFHNPLRSISLFVLLDLLGSSNPQIPSYFQTTHWAYQRMSDLEGRLRAGSLLRSSPNHRSKRVADANGKVPAMRSERLWLYNTKKNPDQFFSSGVEDDHLPFMAAGVQILHIIPTPFPAVWHAIEDDGEHLDMDTVEDWTKIVLAFTVEWLELDGFMGHASSSEKPKVSRNHDEKSEFAER